MNIIDFFLCFVQDYVEETLLYDKSNISSE